MFRAIRRYPLVVVLVIGAMVAAGLSIPTFNVVLQQLGEGSGAITSPVGTAYISFNEGASPGVIVSYNVSFDQNLSAGAVITIQALNSTGGVIDTASLTLSSALPAGSVVTIPVSSGSISKSELASVVVYVDGQRVN